MQATENIHNTAKTSIEAWKVINNDGTRAKQKQKVFEAICNNGPITSRKLSTITGIERAAICRTVYDLLHEVSPQIKIAYTAKCEVTGRTVEHYSSVTWQQIQPGVGKSVQARMILV